MTAQGTRLVLGPSLGTLETDGSLDGGGCHRNFGKAGPAGIQNFELPLTQVRVRATKVAVEIRNRRSQQHNQVQQQLKRLCPDIGRKWLCKDHFRALRGTLHRQIVVLLALQRNPTKSTKGGRLGGSSDTR